MKFLYTAWFRDKNLASDDPDHEWPACIIIDARSISEAVAWGDHLAARYSKVTNEQMISSSAEELESAGVPGKDKLPEIPYGYEATDDEIGW